MGKHFSSAITAEANQPPARRGRLPQHIAHEAQPAEQLQILLLGSDCLGELRLVWRASQRASYLPVLPVTFYVKTETGARASPSSPFPPLRFFRNSAAGHLFLRPPLWARR